MTEVLSGLLTASCLIVGGYLFYKCAGMQRKNINNEYYIVPNNQLIEKQPPPPEYSVATAPSAPLL
jgi:hypothetical protein